MKKYTKYLNFMIDTQMYILEKQIGILEEVKEKLNNSISNNSKDQSEKLKQFLIDTMSGLSK